MSKLSSIPQRPRPSETQSSSAARKSTKPSKTQTSKPSYVGGSTANQLLSYLDYVLIKSNPKIFCGYSDITLLHTAIFTQTGLQTFYGPSVIPEFGEQPEAFQFTTDHFLHVLQGSVGKAVGTVPRSSHYAEKLPDFFFSNEVPRELSPSPAWTWLRSGAATGRIFGGCIPSVLRLAGTKCWPNYRGRILLLETSVTENIENGPPLGKMRSCMADLVNVVVFEEISGLVVGRPYRYDEKMLEEFKKMIVDQCFRTKFPILMNVDVGHTSPLLTIPLNAMVRLDAGRDEFCVLEAGVVGNRC